MKICIISHYSELGGAERALLETVEALRLFDAQSFVLLPLKGSLCPELQKKGIPFRVLPYRWWAGGRRTPLWRRGKNLLLSLLSILPLAAEIRRQHCDVVLTNTITIGVGPFAARLAGRPHVWFIHEFFGTPDTDLSFHLGQRFSLAVMDRLSDLCLANSRAVAGTYRARLPHAPLKTVYQSVTVNGIGPAEECAPSGRKTFGCVAVGTLCALKGQMDAVQAVSMLSKGGEEVTLDLVGGGDPQYAADLKRTVRESGVGHLVRFRGPVENAFPFVQRADAALICSRSESFGRATVEAMLAGKPVIGARRGGTEELIREDFNGLLYEPGDPVELAGKIRRLLADPGCGRRMGQNGKAWAQVRFSRERYGERLFGLLSPLLDRGRRG